MQFYRHADGSVTVDELDEKIMITWELLESLDPKVASVSSDWEQLTILGAKYERVYSSSSERVAGYARVY